MVWRSDSIYSWSVGLGLGVALSLLSCGDENDPDAVSALELKSPSALRIIDDGEGKIRLKWSGPNPEDAFEGYNVYGAKLTNTELAAISLTKGQPIQLLDNAGDAVEAVKTTILPKFDYTTANSNALPGAGESPASIEEDTELSKLPFHQRNSSDATDPLLPTCRTATGNQTCVLNTSATEVDAAGYSSNGVVEFNLGESIQLDEGSQYCFFVLSVQSGGKEVSSSSTNVECVTPRYKATFTWSASSIMQA